MAFATSACLYVLRALETHHYLTLPVLTRKLCHWDKSSPKVFYLLTNFLSSLICPFTIKFTRQEVHPIFRHNTTPVHTGFVVVFVRCLCSVSSMNYVKGTTKILGLTDLALWKLILVLQDSLHEMHVAADYPSWANPSDMNGLGTLMDNALSIHNWSFPHSSSASYDVHFSNSMPVMFTGTFLALYRCTYSSLTVGV